MGPNCPAQPHGHAENFRAGAYCSQAQSFICIAGKRHRACTSSQMLDQDRGEQLRNPQVLFDGLAPDSTFANPFAQNHSPGASGEIMLEH